MIEKETSLFTESCLYNAEFYSDRHEKTRYAAEAVLTIVLETIPPVGSAIDFGCGIGTWLSVLQENGTDHIKGLDGPWVNKNLLVIPEDSFKVFDFNNSFTTDERYGLAISLEVAEHLPECKAEMFVSNLVNLSDFILFSAAIPGQGGVNHVNEQWQSYWAKILKKMDIYLLILLEERFGAKIQCQYLTDKTLFYM